MNCRLAIALTVLGIALLLFTSCTPQGIGENSSEENTITIYSARHYSMDSVIFDAFTEQTGIKVIEVKGTAEELIQRLREEGTNTSADLFMTADGIVLQDAKEKGLLQPIQSDIIRAQVSEQWQDPDQHWTAITARARVIVYAKDRVRPEELSTYEDLANERWRGKLLVRSSYNLYNQALMASMIEDIGEEASTQWAEGIVHNFARSPEGGDRSQAKAIAAGTGDIAIMNTYYIGQMQQSTDPDDTKAVEQLGVYFPNQQTAGAHVNISGIGVVKHAKHKKQAVQFIEYMTNKDVQSQLTKLSFEYPVNPEAEVPELLQQWGRFKAQSYSVKQLYQHYQEAVSIFQKVGWK